MVNNWLYNSGLKKCCNELKESLSVWYNANKRKAMTGHDLYDARKMFFTNNPQYQKYDEDIHSGYDVDGNTWKRGCLDGCCQTRATVRGVYAVPINWDDIRHLALGSV